MAKITIDNILASFAGTTAINARFQQVEDELNNKVLYRDPGVEANSMAADFDMDNNDILNVNVLNAASLNVTGTGLLAQVGYAEEWASKAEDSLISVAAGGDGATEFSALHWAAKSAADVVLTTQDTVDTAADLVATNQDTIDTAADLVLTNADVVTAEAVKTNLQATWYLPRAVETNLDDNGDASTAGDTYFNTALNKNRVYDGATWGDTGNGSSSANTVNIGDTGGYYAGTEVESALQEVGDNRTLSISVTSIGSKVRGSASLSASRTSTGVYLITHNRGALDYVPIAALTSGYISDLLVTTVSETNNTFVVQIFDNLGNPANGSFTALMAII